MKLVFVYVKSIINTVLKVMDIVADKFTLKGNSEFIRSG